MGNTSKKILTDFTIPSLSEAYHMPPLHFIRCSRVTVLCKVPEGTIAELLPEPLEPAGDFIYINWLRTGDWGEELEPEQNFTNMSLNFPCKYKGTLARHCTLEYMDSEMGLVAGREMFAYPKKGASISWEKSSNGDLNLTCSRHNEVLMHAKVSIDNDRNSVDWVRDFNAPDIGPDIFQVRYLAPSKSEPPELAEVQRVGFYNSKIYTTKPANASIELFSRQYDSFEAIQDIEVLSAKVETSEVDLGFNEIIGTHQL